MVVEVMGRHTGWIAVMSGLAGGADAILIPEQPITVEAACGELQRRHERGKDFSIVVVSEGYELTYESGEQRAVTQEAETDQFGHVRLGGVGEALARDIEERTGYGPASPSWAMSSAGAPHAARPCPGDALRPQGRRSGRGGPLRPHGGTPG